MLVSASLWAASGALRIASLNLCTDEYLLLLARPAEVASVSRLSHDPDESTLAPLARRFPANRGNLESALRQRPTLVLTMGGAGRSTTLVARRLGIRSIDFAYPANIAEVEAAMVRVAAALGEPSRATGWRQRLARLRATTPAPRDTIFLGRGGDSVARSSLAAEWMRLGGFDQRSLRGGRASLETLAVRPPEVLLRSAYRRDQPSLSQRWLDHPLVARLNARAIDTDGRRWTCAGPLMLEEVERLRALR